jgi:undecaprenyl-diphosphatase
MIPIIILAIVQGIAEFLPISSSAHLIIVRDIFGIGSNIDPNLHLTFDIALHFGTLLAILLYFYKDWFKILKDINKIILLIVATIPAAIAGILLEDVVDSFFRKEYLIIAVVLGIVGIIIYKVDKISKSNKTINDITIKDSFIVGLFQTFALIPGFSRSGTTIATSRYLGINKEDACKFSFYLSAPVVGGAVLLSLLKDETIPLIVSNANYFIIGILISFITGLLCIHYLLKYIKNNDFKLFMYYRIILSAIIIIKLFI